MSIINQPERTHVLHIITRLIVGGAQENTLFSAALLDKARYQVEVLSGPQTGSEGSLIEEVRQSGVPLTILPELVRQIDPLKDIQALFKLRRFIRQGKFQVVHTHSSKAGVIGRLAAHLEGTPVIIHTVHGWSFHDYMSPAARKVYIQLERYLAHFSDALVVVSQGDQAKGLKAEIGEPGQYLRIRSAIPLEAFDPNLFDRVEVRLELGLPGDALVIGNVGRFSAQKNPLEWVMTAGKLLKSFPQAYFLLVGDGPLRSEVEAVAVAQGIHNRLVMTGLRRDPARMMAAMDIFLLTSLWEGLPRVIPQAMALGLPVVATHADGTGEIIQDGVSGFLCPPGDLDCLVESCLLLARDRSLRASMGQAARLSLKKEFDLGTMVDQIDRLYQELLDKKLRRV